MQPPPGDLLEGIDWGRVAELLLSVKTPGAGSNVVGVVLRPEDLERVDWDLVSSALLGITDPIGQIISAISSILAGFVDTIRRAFEAVVAPISSAISTVLDWIRSIAASVASVADMIRSVVVDPILSALRWVSDNFPRVVSAVTEVISASLEYLGRLPAVVADFASRVGATFSELATRVTEGFRWLLDQVSRLPDVVRDLAGRVAATLGDLLDRVRAGFSWFIDQVARLPDVVRDLVGRVAGLISDLVDRVREGFSWLIEQVGRLPAVVSDLVSRVASAFADLAERVRAGFSWFIEQVSRLPDIVRDLAGRVAGAIGDLLDRVRAGISWFIDQVARLPDLVRDLASRVAGFFGDLAGRIQAGFSWFIDQVTRIPDIVRDLVGRVVGFFADLSERIRAGLAWFIEQVGRVPDIVRDLVGRVVALFGDLAERVRDGFSWFIDQVARLPDVVRDLVGRVAGAIGELLDRIRGGLSWFIEQVTRLPDLVRGVVERIAGALADLAERATGALSTVLDAIAKAPALVRDAVTTIIGDVARGVGGAIEWIMRGFENLGNAIASWFERARDWFESATKLLERLGAALMGFVNAVAQLPTRLREEFGGAVEFFETARSSLSDFLKDPMGWFRRNIVEPVWSGLVGLGTALWSGLTRLGEIVLGGLRWLWERIVEGVNWLRDVVVGFARAVVDWISGAVKGFEEWAYGFVQGWTAPARATAKDVEGIFTTALRRTAGVAENLWLLGGELLLPFWRVTFLPLMLRGIARAFGDLEVAVEPSVAGTKAFGIRYSIRLSELADALTRAIETFYMGYAMGTSMAIASTFMVNLQQLYVPRVVSYYDRVIEDLLKDLLKPELDAGAKVNMFVRPVSEPALMDYARRMLGLASFRAWWTRNPGEFERVARMALATVSAHLKIYGLPLWYIDFLTGSPKEYAIGFPDRFGVLRRIPITPVFELPTHSELARMTQRDIFPGVDIMKMFGYVRGWPEDLTTMIYLLTFRYPSFEKLWTFYMRALAGMLWFEPPETIRKVFEAEAREVGAGVPVSTLQLQKALAGPDQVKAFELALNTYFKWLEYSNFSWFTKETRMYGIDIGAEVVGKLGGWTSDSWLLADVAADIPSKIDMRWMSRYGIFLHMAERFEEVGVRFETYTPLVEAVPKLLEASPATPIQVDLRWFSKLLQATGLHPAWVPIVTVAENIMAIADEMTLLRTGWLNLFKEGMLTVEDADEYLAGLIVASYRVGYWDPERKVWTSGWINLPVRWLPHERRLLELRMAIDRVMDVFREIYSYVRSGIRTLAITPEDAKSRLTKLVEELNKHYRELTKAITGQEFELKLDEKYVALWLEVQKLAQDIEAYERVRVWWSRVSGWVLYRVAYGYVSEEEVAGLIDTVSKYIPLHRVEIDAYREIAKAMLGIARKEAIPSPSTLAAFAEYMVLKRSVIEDVLSKYNVPKEYWDLWTRYIELKPIKADYKAVLTTALKALRYGAITKEYWEWLLKVADAYGFTYTEVNLIWLRAQLELMVEEARNWRPSLPTLISMIEYVPEAVELLERYKVDPAFRAVVERYALVKPLADEVRILVNSLYRAKRYVAVPKELEERVVTIAKQLGVTDAELAIRDLALELQVLVDEARAWVPSPSTLATLSEYVVLPRELVEQALRVRRVPEEWANIWLQYISVRPVKADYRSVLMAALRALRYGAIPKEYWEWLLRAAAQYGFTPTEVSLLQLRAELELMIEEARLWRPTLLTLITISEYVPEAVKLLEYYRVDPVFRPIIERYALVKPLADEVRVLVNALYRAKRYVAIPKGLEDLVLSIVKQFGVTDTELMLRDLALELTTLVEEAREYVPTPSTLATMAEYLPEVRRYIAQAFEARRVRGVWAEVWTKYIYLRPVYDEVRRWATAMFTLAEYLIIDVKQLEPVFKVLATYGWEDLEVAIATKTILAEQVRHAFNAVLGAPRTITGMARYTDKAADWAYSRAVRLIDALPVDESTKKLLKEMWREYIMSYQAYPEIRSYMTELINAYADGVLDDRGLDAELDYLRKIGVPELRLALVRRTAQLRRVRRLARYG